MSLKLLLTSLIVGVAAVGCASADPTPTADVPATVRAIVSESVPPTATPVDAAATAEAVALSIPTSTPPPTATPPPTETPFPTLTPAATVTPPATVTPVGVEETVEAFVQAFTPVPTDTPAPTVTPVATATPQPKPTPVDVLATFEALTPVPTPTPVRLPDVEATSAAVFLAQPTITPVPVQSDEDLATMLDRLGESVMIVQTALNSGTGFVIDPEGFILTAAHVVSGHGEAEVLIDEVWRPAEVVAINEDLDAAILKLETQTGLEQLSFADDVWQGESVFVLAHQFGVYSEATVTSGIVSGFPLIEGIVVLQTDAAVNAGTSGAPVLNGRGAVVGLITSRGQNYENGETEVAQNINYAVRLGNLQEFWENRDDFKPAPAPTPTMAPTIAPTPAITLVYGPVDEVEEDENPYLDLLADGIFEVSMRNPRSRFWRHFLVFRGSEADYNIMVRNDRKIFLYFNPSEGTDVMLWEITSPHVNTDRGGRNKVKVEMKGDAGQLWINDQWISELDLSRWREAGWIFLFSFNDDGDDSELDTEFDDFRIWKYN